MADSTTLEEDVVKAALMALGGLLLGAVLAVWFAIRHPRTTIVVGALAAALLLLGPTGLGLAVGALAVAGLAWRCGHRDSFDWLFLGAWRRAVVYAPRWEQTMSLTGLMGVHRREDNEWAELVGEDRPPSRRSAPKLGRVRSNRWEDRVRVRLLAGQHPSQLDLCTDHLAHTFGALACRVEVDLRGRVTLVFGRRDRLAAIVPALPIPTGTPDLAALPVGVLENGQPWTVQLAGSHLLTAGATGSGKGSLLHSLMRAMAPAIHDGTVRVHAIDPKGGMELGVCEPMYARFAYETPEAMADLLDDTCDLLTERAKRMRAEGRRKHTATVVEPLVVVLVDELAFLTAYMPDQKLRKRVTSSLSVLLSQGRAVGFCVVAALQDPRKEVATFRDLFPQRIALRLNEPEQTRLVLGPGAHERGAECENIPTSSPGVGYVVLDGLPWPQRGRLAYPTDTDIATTVEHYPARRGDVIDTTATPATATDDGHTGSAVIDIAPRPDDGDEDAAA